MDEREHEQSAGTPTWADVATADTAATADFFTQLLDWQVDDGSQELGGYRIAMAQKMATSGISEPMLPDGEQHTQDETLVYLATDDVDDTVTRVTELGGSMEQEPRDVAELGRMAVATDPQGNRFGLWQAGSLGGFSAVNDQGLPTWFEVRGSDIDALAAFYGELFGMDLEEQSFAHGHYRVNDRFGITDGEPGWIVYYWVLDLPAAMEKALGLGASVELEPYSFEFGSAADLRTPGGARFGLFQPAPQG